MGQKVCTKFSRKDRLITALVLTLSTTRVGYVVFNDASKQGLRCVPMQGGKVIAYVSRQLNNFGVLEIYVLQINKVIRNGDFWKF